MKNLSFLVTFLLLAFACQTSCQSEKSNKTISDSDSMEVQVNKYRADSSDIDIYNKIIAFANQNQLNTKDFSEVEIAVANQLMGIPYVGQTLEKDSVEKLIVNLRELDCTTFVENVLAISLCIKNKTTSFDDYCEMLVKLRYRNGIIDQYPSRLHYTTDWLLDNQKKGIIEIVTEKFATDNFDASVNYMSSHPESYKQLINANFVEKIKQYEIGISASKLKFVSKDKINEVSKFIKDGDMIALTTTIPGMDVSHVAIAAWHNNQLHFIHASSKDKKVELSDITLFEYLAGKKINDGILVARLVEHRN